MRLLTNLRRRKQADSDDVYVSERYGVRSLHIGTDTIQSSMRVARPDDLELSYTRSMMGFLLFVPVPRDVLMIGLGGGSLAKFVHRNLPDTRTTAVELNAKVLAIARQYFEVPHDDHRLTVMLGDGAEYVGKHDASADVILLDGYGAEAQAEELTTVAFYSGCRRCLRPGGVLSVNLWGSDRAFDVLLERMSEAFEGAILCLPAERPGNIVVFAFERAPGSAFRWDALAARADALELQYGLEFPRFVVGLRKMNRHDADSLLLPAVER